MSDVNIEQIKELDAKKPADQKRMAGLIEDIYSRNRPYISNLSLIWDENIRFFEGDQYIYYNESNKRFEELPSSKYNDFIPRPVTNLILPIVFTVCSVLTKSKPTALVFPNSEDEGDICLSKIAERICDTKWEIDKEQELLIDSALILLLCGTVYRKDSWDNTIGGHYDDGETQMWIGDNRVEILSPFEVVPDITGDEYIYEARVQSLSYIRGRYGKKGNGFTGLANKVKESKALSTALSYRERLRTSSGLYSGTEGDVTNRAEKNSSVLIEFYLKPCDKYPSGLVIHEAGGVPLFVGTKKDYNPEFPDSWNPFTETVWIRTPLRRHGVSLVENLIQLQKRLNGIDSLVMLNRMTMATPSWLLPHGCGVPEGYITGRPGLNIPYRPVGANGASPSPVPGVGLPADIFQERQQVVQEMHQIAMDNEVLSGNQPSGVNTASALNMLLEQSFSKFSPFIQRWEKFIESGQQKKLLLIQAYYNEPRPKLFSFSKALNGDGTHIFQDDFVASDLRDNINIRIEAGSSLPRSKVVEQQQILQLAQMGVLGDITPQNPIANQKILEKFGLKAFDSINNPDIVRARYNIKVLHKINAGEVPPEMYPKMNIYDDVQVHMKILTDEMKSPDFNDESGIFQQKFEELNNAMTEINSPPVEGEGVLGGATSQGTSPEQMAGELPADVPQQMMPEGQF